MQTIKSKLENTLWQNFTKQLHAQGFTMKHHIEINDTDLRRKIKQKEICLGGNRKLKIYGTLHCTSGKRMKKANRVFFASIEEALQNRFRPCGHCMPSEYKKWKNGLVQ